jgi:translocator assembly and maintenance protein 41
LNEDSRSHLSTASSKASSSAEPAAAQPTASTQSSSDDGAHQSLPPGWEDDTDYNISSFKDLPHRFFGHNQHIRINEDFKESLRQVLWQFKAPIRYAFAYGSGVFGQKSSGGSAVGALSPHPNPPKAVQEWQKGGAKVIDFVFGVSHTQHWHSLNLAQHPDHYSGLKWLPNSSAAVSHMQDDWGAGLYYNPYITVNGIMIKYGVVNLDTLARDLSEWDTLYLAGRLQKPVKILRDDPRIRLSNQVNLISALRTALLMLPEHFTERQLYERIAGLSYLGDPRMSSLLASEAPNKVSNIVGAQLPGFRQLYVPLIDNMPNVDFNDPRTPGYHSWEKEDAIRHTGTNHKLDNVLGGEDGLKLSQDMDPVKRGNMVRRLPKAFRRKIYYQYKQKFQIPGSAFSDILQESQDDDPTGFRRREGGDFERQIAEDSDLPQQMAQGVRSTVSWPATMQTIKGVFTSGVGRSWKYLQEKRSKGRKQPSKVEDVDTASKKSD